MSELALKLIAREKEEKTGSLDLGNCGLAELPEELFELRHLESLMVSNEYYDWRERKWVESSNKGPKNYIRNIPGQVTLLVDLNILIITGGRSRWEIEDISCLEALSQLQTLYLSSNQITDISFLEKLTQLKSLDLISNQITDISLLEKLPQLQSLYLSNNQITDHSFLEKLPQLQFLDLSYNQITDYNFLEKLPQLQTLDLSNNQITDISFLEKLTQLQTLYLRNTKITDYSFLEKLTQLQSLDLSNNQITDISFLEKLTQLQTLYLRNTKITDYSFLEKLTQLQSLDLSNNQITDISFLEKLTQLQSLDLNYNQITDISFLEKLTQLKSLYLIFNQITNINFLEKLPQLQSLYLSYNQITNISFLEKLTRLQSLDLRNNQITDISFLEKLTQLQTLELSRNKITDISFLEKLPQLQTLELSRNKITDISFLEKLIQLQTLDLSYTKITDYSFLEKLTQLQSLDLRGNQITNYNFLEKLTQLQSLYLSSSQIIDYNFLEKLTQLQSLYLSSSQITDYNFLEKLTQLKSLHLSNNQITDYSFLEKLTQLQTLSLRNNQITDINFLEKLTQLQTLSLRNNQITDYSFLEKLTQLESLDLSNNQITDINFLEKLTQLQTLDLSNNQITDISFLEKLTQLQTLDLSNNQITDISFPEKLTQLQILDLSNNQITDISFPEKLTQLQSLYLSDNKINDISSLRGLAEKALLQTLNISKNKIEDLTPVLPLIERGNKMLWKEYGSGILVQDNPLKTPPPEIIKEGNEAVLKYFQDLKQQGVDYLYEAKLLIVGEGESGKTSLAWKLKDMDAPMPKKGDDRTKGIDIQSLEIDNQVNTDRPFRMNVWDFGGQEIYHATHQFFLTKRSLYLIVNNTRSNLTDFNHWVQTINLFSDNSPILIVQNEVAGSAPDFDLRGLQQYFANVLGLKDSDLSNIEDGRLQKLIREIHHQIQQLDHVGMELPRNWVAVRKDLELLSKEKPFISNRDFFQICEQNEISEKEAMQRIGDIFHDLGVLLYFHEDPILRKLVILQNNWATKGVYAILDNDQIQKQKGRFSFTDADQIWEGTEFEGKETELLQLMTKFELCYRVPFQEPALYVSPQLLPKEKPVYQWNNQQNLILYYRYEFMPKGLLGRLIVRLHRYVKDIDQYAWRTGCIFTYEHTDAQVIETYGASRIEIRINGEHRSKIATIITKEIDELNESFEQIVVDKLIPCNCRKCSQGKEPQFYKYEVLLRKQERGKSTIECPESDEDVNIQVILDGVFERIPEHKKSIFSFVKNDDLEEAINVLGKTHSKEAALLHQRLLAGKRFFALGLMTAEDWSVLRLQIGEGILTVSEMPSTKISESPSPNSKVDQQLNNIEAKLTSQEKLLNRIVEQNDSHQQEIITVLDDFASQPPDEAYIEELVAVVERGMADLQTKIPESSEIVKEWLEASKQLKLAADSKVKLKWAIPFLFFNIEKEVSWNGKDYFKAIREDVKRGRKGNWQEMFVKEV